MLVNKLCGVATHQAEEGEEVEIVIVGCFDLPKADCSLALGDPAYWDPVGMNGTNAPQGNARIGVVVAAASEVAEIVRVRLQDHRLIGDIVSLSAPPPDSFHAPQRRIRALSNSGGSVNAAPVDASPPATDRRSASRTASAGAFDVSPGAWLEHCFTSSVIAWRKEDEMAYAIKHGTDPNVKTERLETATACLERAKALEAEHEANIKVFTREGAEITMLELERLSGKELI